MSGGRKTPVAGMIHSLTLLASSYSRRPREKRSLAALAAILMIVRTTWGEWQEIPGNLKSVQPIYRRGLITVTLTVVTI